MGVSYDDKGEYSKAIEMYGMSLQLLKKLQESPLDSTQNLFANEAIILNNIGYAYFNLGRYEEALKNYFEGDKMWVHYNGFNSIGFFVHLVHGDSYIT